MRARLYLTGILFVAYGLLVSPGCGPAAPPAGKAPAAKHDGHDHDHDHDHDHGKDGKSEGKEAAKDKPNVQAKNYADAISQLGAMHVKIRDAFGKKDVDTAHGPLHDIGHLLEQIPVLAGQETKDEARLAELKKVVDELFDHYGKVDEKLHGEEGATYEEVADKIDAAMEKLKKLTLAKSES